jgi:hypothetical protein
MMSATGVLGAAFLGPITYARDHSFNWWMANANSLLDWGPWLQSNSYFDFLTGGLGVPDGDRNKYFILSDGEVDYDQLESAVDHTGEGWLPPGQISSLIAAGGDTRFLLSVGPSDILPDEPMRFAVVFA